MVLSHFKGVTHRKNREGKYGCWRTGSGLHLLARLGLRPQSGSGWAVLPSSEPPGAPGALPAVLSPTGGPRACKRPVRPAAAAQTALCPPPAEPSGESSAPPAHWGPWASLPGWNEEPLSGVHRREMEPWVQGVPAPLRAPILLTGGLRSVLAAWDVSQASSVGTPGAAPLLCLWPRESLWGPGLFPQTCLHGHYPRSLMAKSYRSQPQVL